jgi:hypothetical protein
MNRKKGVTFLGNRERERESNAMVQCLLTYNWRKYIKKVVIDARCIVFLVKSKVGCAHSIIFVPRVELVSVSPPSE